MESITDKVQSDEPAPPEPTISQLVDKIGAALTRLLRLVRPAQADAISATVDEVQAVLRELLEAGLRGAHLQSAGTIAPITDRLERIEARLSALEEAP